MVGFPALDSTPFDDSSKPKNTMSDYDEEVEEEEIEEEIEEEVEEEEEEEEDDEQSGTAQPAAAKESDAPKVHYLHSPRI